MTFRATDAQVRDLIRRAAVASGYEDNGGPLGSLESVAFWGGKPLYWLCYRGKAPGEWALCHGPDHRKLRPWSRRYPDASALVREAGLEVLHEGDAV